MNYSFSTTASGTGGIGGAILAGAAIIAVLGGLLLSAGVAPAQEKTPSPAKPAGEPKKNREISEAESVRKVEGELAEEEEPKKAAEDAVEAVDGKEINVLTLLFRGGHLMWPIVAMSLLVVTFGGRPPSSLYI